MLKLVVLAFMVVVVTCVNVTKFSSLNFYTSEEGCSGNGTSIKTGECTTAEMVNCGTTYLSINVDPEGAFVQFFEDVKCQGPGLNWGTYCQIEDRCVYTGCPEPFTIDGEEYYRADCTAEE
mmetsp:Transcript_1227/g.3259  ORF Transcript_1227/g.3259 Transcript_1227/m.3259 type:complete len:121 (+) Transcript_1227:111-473(+)|eukprot:CAMPEP_0119132958 /NCGR_PEP_ID=MMETSP1310-20130426/12689_1 /TAXON_ID=464262 /ORGANISM="Genus nov. species nov., Strain RCC2339" /LENGTH=120 /DNA_ID=CAMNT_0007123627 /DNA_START=111 /DNA_END=473 /DNA_ORIENTATION=+